MTGLLIIPLLAMLGLWAILATVTLGSAFSERSEYSQSNGVSGSTQGVLVALEAERAATFELLNLPKSQKPLLSLQANLAAERRAASAAIAGYEKTFPRFLPTRAGVLAKLAQVPAIRKAVDSRTDTATASFNAYSGVINGLFTAIASSTLPDASLYRHTLGLIEAGQMIEQFSREVALTQAAQFHGNTLPTEDGRLFTAAVADQQLLEQETLSRGSPQLDAAVTALYNSPLHTQVAQLESAISTNGANPAKLGPALQTWGKAAPAFLQQLTAASLAAVQPIQAESSQVSGQLFLKAGLAGGIGLIAIIAVALLAFRFGRRIRRELTSLHDGAAEMASERLPALIERLSAGDDVDVAAESPPLAAGRITEIARVAQAFSDVQSTAVRAAVGQASLRQGVSKVFVNLSLRNQSILHRQLGMLDSLERATDDPAALADLFRLDHLTTRMRRNAENLIVLSGTATGRAWREPVQLVDVLRAAIAEVEDYTRIEVSCHTPAAITGPAANDVVHLLAELMENATSFSPPNTRVDARVEDVGSGVAVEIEDRGLGLTRLELAAINARLEDPPGFDVVATEHLGMFVVAQLAARHGISVALRRSHYGGVAAVVLLPHSIILPLGGLAPALPGGVASQLAGNGNGSANANGAGSASGAGTGNGHGVPARNGTAADDTDVIEPTLTTRARPRASGNGHRNGNGDGGTSAAGESASAGGPALPRRRRSSRGPFEPIRQDDGDGEQVQPEPPAPAPVPDDTVTHPYPAAPGYPAEPGYQAPPAGAGVPAAPPAASAGSAPAEGATYRGLPRRVRQASLAPQLNNGAARPAARSSRAAGALAASIVAASPTDPGVPVQGVPEPAAPLAPERSPENTFSTFSSLQSGWQRGREEALDHPDGVGGGGQPHEVGGEPE